MGFKTENSLIVTYSIQYGGCPAMGHYALGASQVCTSLKLLRNFSLCLQTSLGITHHLV
jgi:hypothetical protein